MMVTDKLCDAAGFAINCNGDLCIAHLITRKLKLGKKVRNKGYLRVCKAHELYFNSQPMEVWGKFVRVNFPDRYDIVKARYKSLIEEFQKFLDIFKED